VFFRDGGYVDTPGDTYGRSDADWVLYGGFDIKTAVEVARYSVDHVNGIALQRAQNPHR
jgi:hypothetical protein